MLRLATSLDLTIKVKILLKKVVLKIIFLKFEKMKKSFVEYHGCSLVYKDGTRQIIKRHCFKPTLYPFWKLSNDVTNSVAKSTRAQLKNKSMASNDEILNYKWQKNLISHKTFLEFNDEINLSNKLTGDTLIIDQNIKKETQTTNNKPIPESNEL